MNLSKMSLFAASLIAMNASNSYADLGGIVLDETNALTSLDYDVNAQVIESAGIVFKNLSNTTAPSFEVQWFLVREPSNGCNLVHVQNEGLPQLNLAQSNVGTLLPGQITRAILPSTYDLNEVVNTVGPYSYLFGRYCLGAHVSETVGGVTELSYVFPDVLVVYDNTTGISEVLDKSMQPGFEFDELTVNNIIGNVVFSSKNTSLQNKNWPSGYYILVFRANNKSYSKKIFQK